MDGYRALDNPKFRFIDEADFFRDPEQQDVRYVSERYITKSHEYIVMVSIPNAPDDLFESIGKEPDETFFTNVLNWTILMVLAKHTQ